MTFNPDVLTDWRSVRIQMTCEERGRVLPVFPHRDADSLPIINALNMQQRDFGCDVEPQPSASAGGPARSSRVPSRQDAGEKSLLAWRRAEKRSPLNPNYAFDYIVAWKKKKRKTKVIIVMAHFHYMYINVYRDEWGGNEMWRCNYVQEMWCNSAEACK